MKLSEIEKVRDESLEEVNSDPRLNRMRRSHCPLSIDRMYLTFLQNITYGSSLRKYVILEASSFACQGWLAEEGRSGRFLPGELFTLARLLLLPLSQPRTSTIFPQQKSHFRSKPLHLAFFYLQQSFHPRKRCPIVTGGILSIQTKSKSSSPLIRW